MGSILSRFSSRKDEKSDTDSRSATTIRKRFSWRSNKKPADVSGTSVNRSSTMPARTRLQPTEETPEDRKHDDIFDSEQDEKSCSKSVVKPNQNDDTSQHSSGQLEQHNVECAKKPIVCEIPGGKYEEQPIQISSTNEPENKDNMARTISTEEAELLIGRVLPNQENVSPHENITLSGTNSSLTHDNINFNHTEDLVVNKQQLQETLDHSIHDSSLTMDQQEITKDQNGFVDDTQHHFEDKTDLLKDDIHSEIVREEIKLEQNPPLCLSPEGKEEFVHQDIRRNNSTEQLNAENDIIKQEGEENLSIEGSSHNEVMQSSPAVCFSRSNVVEYPPPEQTHLVDIDEQTYNQQTNNISNIQSSETVGEKDLIHEQIVQNELLECSAEPRPFHNLSNNEEFSNSELIDTDNKVNFVETENTLDNFIDTVVKSSAEPVMECDFSSIESRFTSELVLSEENREATTDIDLEHPTEDIKTEDIHHKQANDTETLTTLEESVNLQNTMNSTHIDDEIDQHQILEVSYNQNHSDVPLNADTIDVINSDNLHTNVISENDVLKQQDMFNSMSMNDDNDIMKNLENSKNNEIHEFEDEAQSLVQSVLSNAKEFVINENNFDNHYNSDNNNNNTNLNLTNNNSNNNDYLTTNNNSSMNEEDTIEMKQDITMKTSMEFDHSDLSELNNQLLKNTNDLAIA
ncbi:unnamed protein product [Schistosoma curassoni]|uniref:DUF4614 domain-containing protein n=1 Tax=Schistosoma curassoni TaxID=6186 RepID=A0A183JYG0_9TREM|nr:unnamed protein product [Schistosoma curassoni]